MTTRIARVLQQLLSAPPPGATAGIDTPPISVATLFRRFSPYARPYRRWLWVLLVFNLLAPALETATIWLFKVLVDEVLVPQDLGAFGWIVAAYLGLTLLDGAVSFGQDYLSAWLGGRFLLDLRMRFFRHLQGLAPDFFEQHKLGDIIARLTGDIGAIETLVLSGVADAVRYLLRLLFFTGALLYLQWDLALIALVVTPFFWVAARRFSRRIKEASREQRKHSGAISAVAEESLANIALVQAYGREWYELARFQQENQASFAARLKATRLKAFFSPLVDLLELAGVLLVIALGAWKLAHGQLSLGELLVFLTYLSQLYSPVRGLSRLLNTLYSASASAERIAEFMDQEPMVVERPLEVLTPPVRGAIRFENVSFQYPAASAPALHNLSFEIRPGETVALVGPSGAGKSTLTKLLLRFYDPSAGRLLLDGHDLRRVSLVSLRNAIAVVLQETLIFDGSVHDNIAYGRHGASAEEVLQAARMADAHGFIEVLPEGYATLVGQKGRRLSGGQRQRLAIARAMLRNAPILILDEPTTGLDAETGERVLAPLRRLMTGRTTIIISHNLDTVREADRILVLDHGRLVEQGTHEQLLRQGATYARLYHLHHPLPHPAPEQLPARAVGERSVL